MRWLVVILLILLQTDNAIACGNCYEPDSLLTQITLADPASYKVVYTGLVGLLADEYVRLVSRKWADDVDMHYNSGAIDGFEANNRLRNLWDLRSDYSHNKYADNRTRWWHYSSKWGPITLHHTGPSGDVINIGPIRVNNKFRFNLKGYETDISSIWSYKFKPIVRVTTRAPFVRFAAIGHQFTYKQRGRSVVRVTVAFGFDVANRAALAEVRINLVGW